MSSRLSKNKQERKFEGMKIEIGFLKKGWGGSGNEKF